MNNTEVIILAAGIGSRLEDLTVHIPKCMLEVNGRSLISRSLTLLFGAGFDKIILVTGHKNIVLEKHISSSFSNKNIRLCYNKKYDTKGSASSLLTGVTHIDQGNNCIILESDLIFNSTFLDIAKSLVESTVLMAERSGSGDEVYAYIDKKNQYLAHLTKDTSYMSPDKIRFSGEFSGIAYLDSTTLAMLKHSEQPEGILDYEDLLVQISQKRGIKLGYCEKLYWREIDTKADYDRVKKDFLEETFLE